MSKNKPEPKDILRAIYKREPEKYPDWIDRLSCKGMYKLVDMIEQMLVRERFTDVQIAEYCECPVNFVYAVKTLRHNRVAKYKAELAENEEVANKIMEMRCNSSSNWSDEGCLRLLELVFRR